MFVENCSSVSVKDMQEVYLAFVQQESSFADLKLELSQESLAVLEQARLVFAACRITAKYVDLLDLLKHLDRCMEGVGAVVGNSNEVVLQKAVAEDFAGLLPFKEGSHNIKEIIRWCLKHDFLQQAATMTAEWLPQYLLEAGVISVVDKKVVEDNQIQRKDWDSWAGNLFKNYSPYEQLERVAELDLDELDTKTFRLLIKKSNYSAMEVYKAIKGKNSRLDVFLMRLMQLSISNPPAGFPDFIARLGTEHELRVICETVYGKRGDEALKASVKKGLQSIKNTGSYILHLLETIKQDLLVEMFAFTIKENKKTAKSDAEIMAKIKFRQAVFTKLFDEHRITSHDKVKFLELLHIYMGVVELYRNRMAHGLIAFQGLEGNARIFEQINLLLNMADEIIATESEV